MSATTGPVSLSWPGVTPSRLTTVTTPPMIIGNWIRPSASSSSAFKGLSDELDADGLIQFPMIMGGELFRLQRLVGRAEIHGFCLDLLDAGAGTHGLVVQAIAGCLFI